MLCLSVRLGIVLGALSTVLLPLGAAAAIGPIGIDAGPHVAQSGGTPLRQSDWNAVIAAQPGVRVSSDCPPAPDFTGWGACITVDPASVATLVPGNGLSGQSFVGGYVATAPGDVLYGDIDGDGQEEAVIRIESGGTAGTFGFLLYHQAPRAPLLVGVYPGYKTGVQIESGLLRVTNPFYFPGEPNCCPTALTTNWYQLSGGSLVNYVQQRWSITGPDDQQATVAEITVVAFYRALARHDFEDAYALLSPAFQASHPFNSWQAGYATTADISVTTAAVTPTQVQVTITALDQPRGGRAVAQRFTGTWTLIGDAAAPLGLLLDRASIVAADAGQ